MNIINEQEAKQLAQQLFVRVEDVEVIQEALISKLKSRGPSARTLSAVTNTGFAYVAVIDRSMPSQTELYRLD